MSDRKSLELLLPALSNLSEHHRHDRDAVFSAFTRFLLDTGDYAFAVEAIAQLQQLPDVIAYQQNLREVNRLFCDGKVVIDEREFHASIVKCKVERAHWFAADWLAHLGMHDCIKPGSPRVTDCGGAA